MQPELIKRDPWWRHLIRVLALAGLVVAFIGAAFGAELIVRQFSLGSLASAAVGQVAILVVAVLFVFVDGDGVKPLRITAPWKIIDLFLIPGIVGIQLFGSILTAVIMAANGSLANMEQQAANQLLQSFGSLDLGLALLVALGLALLSGTTEELLFRGYLITRLEKLRLPAWACVAVSALIFALVHVPGYDWLASLSKGLWFGVPTGIYFIKRRNLGPLMAAHALLNFTGFAMSAIAVKLQHLSTM